jgi:hypothetical protein
MDRHPRRTTREKLVEAEDRKTLLAKAVLIRIRAELVEKPDADEFTFPLRSPVGKLERFVLSHYPQDIADRISKKHAISLQLDETVEPPELTVTIGQRPSSV